jgi:hypothetical protein
MHKALDRECVSGVQSQTMHLADYMMNHGLRDEDVAEAIARSRPTVSRIRRRLIRPSWDTIEAIKTFTKGASTADDYVSIGGTQ